jgi:hypothetical protein
MSETTRSTSNPEPQLLSQEGGIQLRHFNPKAVLRFEDRKCITCKNEILNHWLIYAKDPDLRSEYWCDKEGTRYSEGIEDGKWEVPEGFNV